jgi:hypothetical protein
MYNYEKTFWQQYVSKLSLGDVLQSMITVNGVHAQKGVMTLHFLSCSLPLPAWGTRTSGKRSDI